MTDAQAKRVYLETFGDDESDFDAAAWKEIVEEVRQVCAAPTLADAEAVIEWWSVQDEAREIRATARRRGHDVPADPRTEIQPGECVCPRCWYVGEPQERKKMSRTVRSCPRCGCREVAYREVAR